MLNYGSRLLGRNDAVISYGGKTLNYGQLNQLLSQKATELQNRREALDRESKDAGERAYDGLRDRMMQVFINLLSNAAKFCDLEHGRVQVAGRPADAGYLIEVSDNGEGVSEQDRQLIFEKFAKARHRNSGRPSGSGPSKGPVVSAA